MRMCAERSVINGQLGAPASPHTGFSHTALLARSLSGGKYSLWMILSYTGNWDKASA